MLTFGSNDTDEDKKEEPIEVKDNSANGDKKAAEEFEEEKVEPTPAFEKSQQATETSSNSAAEIKFEHPLQKYLRLKEEVSELEKNLKPLADL
ncbi:hypothetical protein RFI_23986, partial [Reticulomyxa filosa]